MTNDKNLNLTILLKGLEQLSATGAYPDFSAEVVDGDIVISVAAEPVHEIRFVYNGIKIDGTLYPAYIWFQDYEDKYCKYPKGTITIISKNYKRFPRIAGLEYRNESDGMTDYFDDDKILIFPDHELHAAAYAVYQKNQERDAARTAKREAAEAARRNTLNSLKNSPKFGPNKRERSL